MLVDVLLSVAISKVACLQTGIRACVAGGKLVVVGLGGEEANLPIAAAACKEVDIIGSFRYANTVSITVSAYHLSFQDCTLIATASTATLPLTYRNSVLN